MGGVDKEGRQRCGFATGENKIDLLKKCPIKKIREQIENDRKQ